MNKATIINLKKQAHFLKPVILIGQKGLTTAVLNETNLALKVHECIKIKLSGCEKDVQRNYISQICEKLQSTLVVHIGHTAVIYRKNED